MGTTVANADGPMSRGKPGDFRFLDLDYFDMLGSKFSCNRDPLTPDIDCDKYTGRAAVDFQVRALEVFYWKNYVHTEGVEAQVKTVGWQWELGLDASSQVSFFYQHHSRHRMDDANPIDYDKNGQPDKFPVEDSYGIRLHFYINDRPHKHLFGD